MPSTSDQSLSNRKSLRKTLRTSRRNLTKKQQSVHARQLAKNMHLCRHYRQVRRIAFYLAEDGEIDTCLAITHSWLVKKQVYLPILSPFEDSLFFARYQPQTRMKKNRFGIAEPATTIRQCKRAHQLQLIFMPLVGFDIKGNRLGMGGGFYDRTLHFRRHQKRWKHPRLVGLAHECQRLDEVPVDHWDVPLDGILTEKKYYRIR